VAGACGKCSSNKEALRSRSGACSPPLHPYCPGWAGDAGVALQRGDGGMLAWPRSSGTVGCSHVWVGGLGMACLSGGKIGCCVGHPSRGVGARDGCPSHAASPHRRGSGLLRRASLPLSSWHFTSPALFPCVLLYFVGFFFSKQISAIYLNNRLSSGKIHGAVGAGDPRSLAGGRGCTCTLPWHSALSQQPAQIRFSFPAPPRALLAHLALSSYLLVHIFQALICLCCKVAALPRFDLPMLPRALLCKGLIWCPGCRLSSLV